MKIGVISDTHIPLRAKHLPQIIVEVFKNVDMIIHAGDLAELSLLDELSLLCPDVRAVWGNMDPKDVKKFLPEKQVITVGKYRIGLTHGRGSSLSIIEIVTEIFAYDKVDIIIFGHSHTPTNERKGKVLYFNPGSLTDTIFAPYKSYGIIEINEEIKASIVKI